jgi:hypothetical protein
MMQPFNRTIPAAAEVATKPQNHKPMNSMNVIGPPGLESGTGDQAFQVPSEKGRER